MELIESNQIILVYTYSRNNSLLPDNLFNFIDTVKNAAKRRFRNHKIEKVNVSVNLNGEFANIFIIMKEI